MLIHNYGRTGASKITAACHSDNNYESANFEGKPLQQDCHHDSLIILNLFFKTKYY